MMNQNIFWIILNNINYYPLNKKMINNNYVYYLFHRKKYNIHICVYKNEEINIFKKLLKFIYPIFNKNYIEQFKYINNDVNFIKYLCILPNMNFFDNINIFIEWAYNKDYLKIIKFLFSLLKYYSINYQLQMYLLTENKYLDITQFLYMNINIPNSNKFIYHNACIQGNLEIVKFLSSLTNIDVYINKLIQWGCFYGHFKVVKYLFSFSNIDLSDDYYLSPKIAVLNGHLKIAQFLYSQDNSLMYSHQMNYYLLKNICQRGKLEIIKFLFPMSYNDPLEINILIKLARKKKQWKVIKFFENIIKKI
jgi:hypothetical protein